MEITVERSQQVADQIEVIKAMLHLLDVDYCKEVVKSMRVQADRQDTLAISRYNPSKSKLIRKQSDMLKKLVEFIELGKECDELKRASETHDQSIERTQSMFL